MNQWIRFGGGGESESDRWRELRKESDTFKEQEMERWKGRWKEKKGGVAQSLFLMCTPEISLTFSGALSPKIFKVILYVQVSLKAWSHPLWTRGFFFLNWMEKWWAKLLCVSKSIRIVLRVSEEDIWSNYFSNHFKLDKYWTSNKTMSKKRSTRTVAKVMSD